jgi:hypothetical protein
MSAALVLDSTATLAYARGSLAVGELLSIVAEDGDTTIVPAACVVEAAALAEGAEVDMLRLLVNLPNVDVVPLQPELALGMGLLVRKGGGVGLAHAATEALAHDAQLATRSGPSAASILPTSVASRVVANSTQQRRVIRRHPRGRRRGVRPLRRRW